MFDRRHLLGALAGFAASAGVAGAAPEKAAALLAAARRQVGVTLAYDPAYARLDFPGGDVPRERGVCTDVVIRAYRDALGLDLQALVNADMRAEFSAYPRRWSLAHPDSNIDHRRVPNLRMFFARAGAELPHADPAGFRPGDLVTMLLPGNLDHVGIASDRLGERDWPMLVHNIGQGAREESVMPQFALTGRYRWRLG